MQSATFSGLCAETVFPGEAQIHLSLRRIKSQQGATGAALSKIFLRPGAEVQRGAKIQSVIGRSIVANVHGTLQSLVRDLAHQDVPYFVRRRILHLYPSELRREGSRMSVGSNVR
jgi:hypothetical protein